MNDDGLSTGDAVGRRRLLAGGIGVGATLLAGCVGTREERGESSGTFRLLVSDQPAVIEEFESLDVALSAARVYERDEEETNETATNATATDDTATTESEADGAGVVEFDLAGETVDLTAVVGDRALPVLEDELPAGEYARIELVVESAEGVVAGETVEVRVPSGRLRIVRPFTVEAGGSVEFVFDITVVRRGQTGRYNLTPVVGKSGVAGEDVEVEEVDATASENRSAGANQSRAGGASQSRSGGS